jgi:hypothetical protein
VAGGSQAVLVDGAAFKDRGGESRQLTDEEFKACIKPRNSKVRDINQ